MNSFPWYKHEIAGGFEEPVPLGLRAKNKADKLRRIKAAARRLFHQKGYEAATTREIAELAGVSVGTVFVYAPDKGELVCLMAADRLKREFSRAFKACDPGLPLLEQILAVCTHMFRNAAKDVPLSRILIKEFMSHRGKYGMDEWVAMHFEKLLLAARERREISFDEDSAFVARMVNFTYLAEMRDWIMTDAPKPAHGVGNLRRSFAIVLRGLNYRSAANPDRRRTSA
jgi:AcrR family transcriptional regulator